MILYAGLCVELVRHQLSTGSSSGLVFLKSCGKHRTPRSGRPQMPTATDVAGNETEAAVLEAKPTTPKSILRRDSSASSAAAEGATRKRVTFEEVRDYPTKAKI